MQLLEGERCPGSTLFKGKLFEIIYERTEEQLPNGQSDYGTTLYGLNAIIKIPGIKELIGFSNYKTGLPWRDYIMRKRSKISKKTVQNFISLAKAKPSAHFKNGTGEGRLYGLMIYFFRH